MLLAQRMLDRAHSGAPMLLRYVAVRSFLANLSAVLPNLQGNE
jgi:hypothetical protein